MMYVTRGPVAKTRRSQAKLQLPDRIRTLPQMMNMNGSAFKDIEKLEADLWEAADNVVLLSSIALLPRLMNGEVAV